MSFPNIPNITPNISITEDQAITLLLASIAFEELGLAHIINAEAEKIQFVVGTLQGSTSNPTIADLIAIDETVHSTLKDVIKKEMLLEFKLEEIINIPSPSISIKKYISVDNGITWHDAQTAPGPILLAPTNPMFRFVVTNTGNVALTLVSVTDSDLGPISIGGTLAPGASFEQIHTGIFAAGQQTNTATVSGSYQGHQVQDSDVAFYLGV